MLTEEKVQETKRIVKRVMKGYMPDEKTKAWRSVHNYMQIAELQHDIIQMGDHVELGEGNYAADVMVITDTDPSKEEMDLLRSILRAIDIPETEIYRTKTFPQMWETTETSIINPIVVINFGGHSAASKAPYNLTERTRAIFTHSLKDMLPDATNCQDAKMEAWTSIKEIMKYYDEVLDREKG